MSLILKNFEIIHQSRRMFPTLSIELKGGTIATLMGPSGCGKSTLLAAVSGTLNPDFRVLGEIRLDDNLLNHLPTEQRQVGILFQDDLLFPHFNVQQNLMFGIPANIKGEDRKKVATQALNQADLEGFEKRDIGTLSGGQKARISLLRALLARPKALLLDEPFSKLDTELRQSFRGFVLEQIQQMQIPALLVSHDKSDCYQPEYLDLQSGEYRPC